MTVPPGSGLLLDRDRHQILAELLAGHGAYVPEWRPAPGGLGYGMAEITAGYLELLQQRLGRVPDHRLAVLLDMLGASPLPAQGARTHVLLTAVPGTPGARVPRGTRIGASVPGRSEPVVFETRDGISIAPAALVEVHSVQPGEDAEQDHSADALAHRPFVLFSDLSPVERILYIGDDALLAFDGRAVVELEFGLSVPASAALPLTWNWWDGTQWRAFTDFATSPTAAGDDDSVDGTAGLTRSGTVRLVAPRAKAVPLELDGRTTHWIRGALDTRLTLPEGSPLPTISRLRLAARNEHRRLRVQRESVMASSQALSVRVHWPLAAGPTATLHYRDLTTDDPNDDPASTSVSLGGLDAAGLQSVPAQHVVRLGVSPQDPPGVTTARLPLSRDHDLTDPLVVDPATRIHLSVVEGLTLDKGVADLRPVDLSKTFAPLGPSPDRGTAFHFACATATARAGTEVTLLIERPRTTAEEVVGKTAEERQAARATKAKLDAIIATLKLPVAGSGVDPEDTVEYHLQQAYQLVIQPLPALLSDAVSDPASPHYNNLTKWFDDLRKRMVELISANSNKTGLLDRLDDIITASTVQTGIDIGEIALAVVTGGASLGVTIPAGAAADVVLATVVNALAKHARTAAVSLEVAAQQVQFDALFKSEPQAFVNHVTQRLARIKLHLERAQAILTVAIHDLESLSATALAVELMYDEKTHLTPPVVAWEYYDGERWRPLGAEGPADVLALKASGSIRFTVPHDIAEVAIDGDTRRWLRARLAGGSYGYLSLVSWMDTENTINFLPVVEPRPPLLDRIEVFYTHRSDPRDPGVVVAHDVHQWRDLTAAVAWPAEGGAPFVRMPEDAPMLYLGLDGPLPADTIGIWLQPAEPSPWALPSRPVWEAYDGLAWVRVATEDGTDGLRRPGVVKLLWPGTDNAPGVTVSGALDTTISLLGKGAATRFPPGRQLMLADAQGQEAVLVAAAQGETVTTRSPLSRTFNRAELTPAPPARFGQPRTWLRAVFDPTLPPPTLTVTRIAAHAVEVVQIETISDELLGSGDGSALQVFVARRWPLAGEVVVEVRELDGDRADLDQAVLDRTLIADHVDPAAVRKVTNPRTNRVTEVWVPWKAVTSLGSGGPNDRIFVLDRAQGRILFGGRGHGRPLPAGRDNVRLKTYSTTAGDQGNVGPGAVSQLMSAVAVGEVSNPVRAYGGAATEAPGDTLRRAPALLRHRRLALTEADVEAIAREASPAVARARALGARDRYGRPLPGAVQVAIVPRDGSDRPEPDPGLLATVRSAIAAASPATAAPGVTVTGPSYLPVGISVTVIPQAFRDAGVVREDVRRQLREFLHPLTGGGDGTGWDFGFGAHLSDIARLIESVDGVDAAAGLELVVDDTTVGDTALVGPHQVVCAGKVSVRLGGGA